MSKLVLFPLFVRDFCTVGGPCSGFLNWDWIFRAQNRPRAASRPGGSQKVAHLPLQQYAGCQSCYRPKYQKSLVFAPVTGRRMLILLQGQIPDPPGHSNFCTSPLFLFIFSILTSNNNKLTLTKDDSTNAHLAPRRVLLLMLQAPFPFKIIDVNKTIMDFLMKSLILIRK